MKRARPSTPDGCDPPRADVSRAPDPARVAAGRCGRSGRTVTGNRFEHRTRTSGRRVRRDPAAGCANPWRRPRAPSQVAGRATGPPSRRGPCPTRLDGCRSPVRLRVDGRRRGDLLGVGRARIDRRARLSGGDADAPRRRSQDRGSRLPGHDGRTGSKDQAGPGDRQGSRMACRLREPAVGHRGRLHLSGPTSANPAGGCGCVAGRWDGRSGVVANPTGADRRHLVRAKRKSW